MQAGTRRLPVSYQAIFSALLWRGGIITSCVEMEVRKLEQPSIESIQLWTGNAEFVRSQGIPLSSGTLILSLPLSVWNPRKIFQFFHQGKWKGGKVSLPTCFDLEWYQYLFTTVWIRVGETDVLKVNTVLHSMVNKMLSEISCSRKHLAKDKSFQSFCYGEIRSSVCCLLLKTKSPILMRSGKGTMAYQRLSGA